MFIIFETTVSFEIRIRTTSTHVVPERRIKKRFRKMHMWETSRPACFEHATPGRLCQGFNRKLTRVDASRWNMMVVQLYICS
jgi:hypothetical protein